MKVLHIGLASHYTEGMTYQDNILPDMNIMDGHDVTYISDTYRYVNGVLTCGEEEDCVLENGLRLIRLKYEKVLNEFVTFRIQKVRKLKIYLEEIKPDVIMYHGFCGYELMDVAAYVKKNKILFYIDSHEDFNNTSKTFLAKLAYKYIHGFYIKKSLPYVKKILYLSKETREYLENMYHLSENVLEFYPLGGILQEVDEKEKQRKKYIEKLNLPEEAIILTHSGKLCKEKKTAEIIRAFSSIPDSKIQLLIFGSIPDESKGELMHLIRKDKRVHFLGWQSGQDIIDILNATDLYLQPGTQSATSQIALCCGCAEVVAPTPSYVEMYADAVIYAASEEKLKRVMKKALEDKQYIKKYKLKGRKYAQEKLDYRILARRYLE